MDRQNGIDTAESHTPGFDAMSEWSLHTIAAALGAAAAPGARSHTATEALVASNPGLAVRVDEQRADSEYDEDDASAQRH